MSERNVIVEKMRKKELEIQSLDEKMRAARIYLSALKDILAALGSEQPESNTNTGPKSGSSVDLARDVILKAGRPVHLPELLEALGKGATKEARSSLGSALAAYVRRGEIFTRPAPNTFGLVELNHINEEARQPPEPPPGFGRASQQGDDDDIPF